MTGCRVSPRSRRVGGGDAHRPPRPQHLRPVNRRPPIPLGKCLARDPPYVFVEKGDQLKSDQARAGRLLSDPHGS
jgi:hypothetical protein